MQSTMLPDYAKALLVQLFARYAADPTELRTCCDEMEKPPALTQQHRDNIDASQVIQQYREKRNRYNGQ